jgi:5-methylcytosine rRNA methyltransferase NSUN4
VKRSKGEEIFNHFFKEIYQDRWETLYCALKAPTKKIARPLYQNINAPIEQYLQSLGPATDEIKDGCYVMDAASVVAPLLLEVKPEDSVLDMCSAPGGKALILIEHLHSKGSITLNDISLARKERLRRVIKQYIKSEDQTLVTLTNFDGLQFGIKRAESFNKILLDTPCSGERHLINDSKELELWSPSRSKKLSSRQYGLLCSALLSLKAEGLLVYSTCSISPFENDSVIEKLIQKKNDQFELDTPNLSLIDGAEKTKYGYIFLPDKSNLGPQYICRIKKRKI